MFTLLMVLYVILMMGSFALILTQFDNKNSFFKTVLSPLEFKIFAALTCFIAALCSAPLIYLFFVDLMNGESKAYGMLAYILIPLVGCFIASKFSNKDENKISN